MYPVTFSKPFIFLNSLSIRGELLKAYEINLTCNVFQFNMMESSQSLRKHCLKTRRMGCFA